MLGAQLAENQLCREGTGCLVHTKLAMKQQLEAKNVSNFWEEHCMQVEGHDPFPLLSTDETYQGSAQFWAPPKKRSMSRLKPVLQRDKKMMKGLQHLFYKKSVRELASSAVEVSRVSHQCT